MIIKQADGTDLEVFTAADLAERTAAAATAASTKALEDYTKAHPDQGSVVSDLQVKLKEAQDALDAAGGDDGQKARLRRERDEANSALKAVRDEFMGKINAIESGNVNAHRDELLNRLTGGKKDLNEKVLFEFDRYNPSDTTREGIALRLQKAFELATGNRANPNVMDSAGHAGARGQFNPAPANKEVSENAKKIGALFGITDEARERLAKKVRSSSQD